MNDLENYFINNHKRLINKWMHYFDVYDRHFSTYRNKEIVIVEIGVSQGGSLQMWKDYFGGKAKIYGIDIDPRCKAFEEENIEIFIGSQSDRKFLREVLKKIPPIDILIDDGGHRMNQQIITFEEMFNQVKIDGVYLCEDIHTSYWLDFAGGHKRAGTFIEYTKNFIDRLNAFHSHQKSLPVDEFTRTVNSIHYYDSIIVIEKKNRAMPHAESTGTATFSHVEPQTGALQMIGRKIVKPCLIILNKVLRFFRLRSVFWK